MRHAALAPLLLVSCLTPLSPPSRPYLPVVDPGPAAAPVEAHEALASLAGSWAVTVTAPGQDAPVGGGSARIEALHGGRYLRLEVALDLDGRPLVLTGHLGHDAERGEWQALWLSDLSTGMSLLSGGGDLERGVQLVGQRGGVRGRSVLTVEGPDAFRLETFGPGPDGRERLLRTSRYVRT